MFLLDEEGCSVREEILTERRVAAAVVAGRGVMTRKKTGLLGESTPLQACDDRCYRDVCAAARGLRTRPGYARFPGPKDEPGNRRALRETRNGRVSDSIVGGAAARTPR